MAYDNGWVEALVVGGLAGAAIYSLVLGYLLAAWRRSPDGPATDLLGGLALLLLGASVGLPALTANRVATIAWILIVLLLARPRELLPADDATGERLVGQRALRPGRLAHPGVRQRQRAQPGDAEVPAQHRVPDREPRKGQQPAEPGEGR